MSHYLPTCLLIFVLTMTGCEDQSSPATTENTAPTVQQETEPNVVQEAPPSDVVGQAEAKPEATPDPAEEAKAHVQELSDRLLGGDTSVKLKLLGPLGAKVESVDGIEITSIVPKYSPNGVKLDDWYRIVIQVQGKEAVTGKAFDKKYTLEVFRDVTTKGEWAIGNVT